MREFYTYILNNDDQSPRLRKKTAPHRKSFMYTLLSGIVKQKHMNLVDKLHRKLSESLEYTIIFQKDAGITSILLENVCQNVHAACNICASSGRSHPRREISPANVNKAFNS